MADSSERYQKNVEGRYYVDESCIYCDLCRETAPTIFAEDKEHGFAYVFKQPETEEEYKLAMESLQGCPTESIGDMENPGIENLRLEVKKWWQIWK